MCGYHCDLTTTSESGASNTNRRRKLEHCCYLHSIPLWGSILHRMLPQHWIMGSNCCLRSYGVAASEINDDYLW